MDNHAAIEQAKEHFGKIIEDQLLRIENMKNEGDFVDYQNKDEIVIGVVGGDGIGPFITKEAEKVLAFLLKDDIDAGKIKLKEIDGLTIENRIKCGKAIPDDVMEELKACDVILKGPTTTPRKGDGMPNIESANVAMRKALDLFANVRPVSVPEKQQRQRNEDDQGDIIGDEHRCEKNTEHKKQGKRRHMPQVGCKMYNRLQYIFLFESFQHAEHHK